MLSDDRFSWPSMDEAPQHVHPRNMDRGAVAPGAEIVYTDE